MDSPVGGLFKKPMSFVSSVDMSAVDRNSIDTGDCVYDTKDRTTLLSKSALKNKNRDCQCPFFDDENESKTETPISQPWITLAHIFCTVSTFFVRTIIDREYYRLASNTTAVRRFRFIPKIILLR